MSKTETETNAARLRVLDEIAEALWDIRDIATEGVVRDQAAELEIEKKIDQRIHGIRARIAMLAGINIPDA